MSRHETGDLLPAVSDASHASVPLNSGKNASTKRKATKPTYYDKRKAKIWTDLQKFIGEERWPSVQSILETGKSDTTLTSIYDWLIYARNNNLNAENVFENQTKPTKAVQTGVIDILNALDRKEDGAGLGTTIEASSGTGTEITVGSDAQHTVGPDSGVRMPSSPSPSPLPPQSQPWKTSQSGRPQKKLKGTHSDCIDMTTQSSPDDEELQRKKSLVSVAERAKGIHSRLKDDEKLNDETIYIVSQVFELGLPPNTPTRILDTMRFKIDEKNIPVKLKYIPKSGEPIYIPLHHESAEHWTLCVLLFESDSEPSSEINSIRLEFYDSLVDLSRSEKVEAFFTEWIKTHYPNFKLTFDQKETAQQNDKTSCGVFVLETIRRLMASEDIMRTIEPMDAKKRFLDMITSTVTNSPSPSANLQVIGAIKELERNCDTSAIIDDSLSTAQEPISIQPSQGIITKIRSLCESEGIPITERLSPAKKEYKRITEEEERLKLELTDARKDLGCANVNVLAVEEVLAMFSESIATDETIDDSSAGVHLQTMKDEPMSDGTPNLNSLVKNPCSNDMLDTFSCVVKNAASDLMQADRARMKDKLAEAMEKARRTPREEVENAERKVEQLTERERYLQIRKRHLDATINLYESLLYLASDGGGKLADESLSTGDVTPSR
ncbi:uncharacterized protein BKA55DRAFT_626399 [Fusarium redolens]|uniref:Ubiquitin-like protease family profile domain-containing protein n=1 Tax=Fusarium redolens TaxID=48865 RepID=A0A9P9G089_FUSRE|nr:uncharacterized protein BKA55DRAFT_626399 [Fusarium redolens]KAH7228545.1 hypothetical protein BKA55DRAFT_626399 [Fusarium redolens]